MKMSLSKLQTRFFARDRISFVRGKGDLTLIQLQANSSAKVEVYLHGGHITSFRDASGKELIYLSENASFTPTSSIRGGIPVCWPQFADLGSLPAHGLLRTSEEWEVFDCKQTKDEVTVVLTHRFFFCAFSSQRDSNTTTAKPCRVGRMAHCPSRLHRSVIMMLMISYG
eukprot:TRINITY_DN2018_c0_g1_i1.p1 TRINITY_DN2018_c0_g1~~TRINITY_DN2018_c0_g1_i1.p1  ORF type:complete len:169 (-),score=12.88 TRINITY_DN2018_c0_g1_i1:259-765(-)